MAVRDTMDILQQRRPLDVADKIAELEPDKSPLVVLLSKLRKKVTYDPQFRALEDSLKARWDAVNHAAGYTAGDTSIVVDNGSYFTKYDVIQDTDTGEQMLVTAVNTSTNTLTVIRGFGTTSAGNISDDDKLLIMGNAFMEGEDPISPNVSNVTYVDNYTQIFRTPFDVTKTLNATRLYGGNERDRLRRKMAIEHLKGIELQFWFGEKKEDNTSGNNVRRTTAGVKSRISTNVTNVGGNLTETAWEAWLRKCFRYGSSDKIVFACPLIISAVSVWAAGKLRMLPSDQTYGIHIMEYLSPHGRVRLVNHVLFEQGYDGYAFCIDMDNIWYRPLNGRDTKLLRDIQNPGADKILDEYLTEAGLQLDLEKTHGMMYGVTGIG